MTVSRPAGDGPTRQWITCSGCPQRWTALNAAHCSVCHETFSANSLFDMHRSAEGPRGSCVPPTEVQGRNGQRRLFFRDGMWRGPEMTEEQKAAAAGRWTP